VRVLALDHGLARVGAAISDPSGTLARPLAAIGPQPAEAAALAHSEGAERVLVGLPVDLNGNEGEQARVARAYADRLAELIEAPVETADERFTTRLAERSAREGASAEQDSLAAAHLLESWLATRDREAPGG